MKIYLSLSIQIPITKYLRQVAYEQQSYFSWFWRRKSNVKMLVDPMSTKNLVHRQLSSSRVLKWQKGWENSLGPPL